MPRRPKRRRVVADACVRTRFTAPIPKPRANQIRNAMAQSVAHRRDRCGHSARVEHINGGSWTDAVGVVVVAVLRAGCADAGEEGVDLALWKLGVCRDLEKGARIFERVETQARKLGVSGDEDRGDAV